MRIAEEKMPCFVHDDGTVRRWVIESLKSKVGSPKLCILFVFGVAEANHEHGVYHISFHPFGNMVAHHSLKACPPNYHRFAPSVIASLAVSTMIFSRLPAVLYFVYLGLAVVDAATTTLDWNIEYATANPDGQFARRVIGVNGKWPPPAVQLNFGDRLVLNVNNHLGENTTTGLHAHGLFQRGTNYYDGAIGTSQWHQPCAFFYD
jgi:hypothetical protein